MFESGSWMYTTPFRTIGFDVNAPNCPVYGSLNVHFFFSVATLDALMSVCVVARELERSKLCAGQPVAALAVTSGGAAPSAPDAAPATSAAATSERAIAARGRCMLVLLSLRDLEAAAHDLLVRVAHEGVGPLLERDRPGDRVDLGHRRRLVHARPADVEVVD